MAGVLAAFAATTVGAASPGASRVVLNGLETRLAPGSLGGITRVLRWSRARPDRTETTYTFLTDRGAGALPEEVQVLGADETPLHLADQEGDCALERVLVRRRGSGAEVLHAVRIFTGDLASTVYSEAAPMEVSVFRSARGGVSGDSAVVLRATAAPKRTRPLCTRAEVEAEMLRIADGRRP